MLLGVVLHSACCYVTFDDAWFLKDSQTSQVMDAITHFLHTFRLPAFFVMAGFFAALLREKRGTWGFLENRMMRLGLPFMLGMLVLYPVLKTLGVWGYFAFRHPDPHPIARTLGWLAEGQLSKSMEPIHLWFLPVLMWTSLAAAALAPRLDRLRADWFRRLLIGRRCLPVMTLVTALTLLTMDRGILETPHSFEPILKIQLFYAVFFVFGWGMYRNRELLPALERHGWGKVALAPLVTIGSLICVLSRWSAPAALLNALICWLMILGLMGLFLRYASQPSARVRYLSDSAYWLYLVHPLVLVAVQIPMLYLAWGIAVKFVLGIVVAVPILLWSYSRLVRGTWIGVMLNGKRMSGRDGDHVLTRHDVVDVPRQRHAVHNVQLPFLPAPQVAQPEVDQG